MLASTIAGIPSAPIGSVDLTRMVQYEQAMKKRVDDGKLVGYTSCVINKGCLVHVSEYGKADMEHGTPFTKDSIVRVYCHTKTMIAAGILILLDRGQLKLTDPVSKYMPSFKNMRVIKCGSAVSTPGPRSPAVAAKFTILRLLTHTGGMGYGKDFANAATDSHTKMYEPLLNAVDNDEIPNLEHLCHELAKLPLRFHPGKALKYAMGADILGRILEVVSGKSLDAFLQTELFEPLGMCDTGFFVPREKASRLAALYGNKDRATRMHKKFGNGPRKLPTAKNALCRIDGDTPSQSMWMQGRECKVISGNGILGANQGGLVSTLADHARFFTMILNGGTLDGIRILKETTLQEWGFENLLPLPGVIGKVRRSGGGWTGWSALGERGNRRTKRDGEPGLDEYEEGEVAMGGAASTYWSVNPVRDQVTLFFTQSLDSDVWGADRATKSGVKKASPDNFTAAARTLAPRDAKAALMRRKRLASDVSETVSRKRLSSDVSDNSPDFKWRKMGA